MTGNCGIHCIGLVKRYGGTVALDDVDICIPAEGIVAIAGPNGAGKTTLLDVITGFVTPDSGRCLIGGHDVTGRRPWVVAGHGVARTFQEVRLVRDLSVMENVLLARPRQIGERLIEGFLGLRAGVDESRNRIAAEQILEYVGLQAAARMRADELSFGQQKILTIACARATEARVLFLDEPVAGVAPAMREKILELLCRLRDDGRLLVFTEHNLEAVRTAADHLLFMESGRVVKYGVPAEVLASERVVRAFLSR